MSELSFEQMLDESFKTIHNGEVVEGTVIDVKPEEIIPVSYTHLCTFPTSCGRFL